MAERASFKMEEKYDLLEVVFELVNRGSLKRPKTIYMKSKKTTESTTILFLSVILENGAEAKEKDDVCGLVRYLAVIYSIYFEANCVRARIDESIRN